MRSHNVSVVIAQCEDTIFFLFVYSKEADAQGLEAQ